MLKYRRNGQYEDIPHYIVDKLGNVFYIFDTNYYSKGINEIVDKKLIKIALENHGWLKKNTITGFLHNWIGDTYRAEPYYSSWRNHLFWDKYTKEQLTSLKNKVDELCDKHNINKKIITTNNLIKNPHKINGILFKSNYSDIYTDINNSFNLNIFEDYDKIK